MARRNNDERVGAVPNTDSPAATQENTTNTGNTTGTGGGLNFVVPTEFVELPSQGKYYPEGHPLHQEESIEIRQMTAKEEDILTSRTLLKKGVSCFLLTYNFLRIFFHFFFQKVYFP